MMRRNGLGPPCLTKPLLPARWSLPSKPIGWCIPAAQTQLLCDDGMRSDMGSHVYKSLKFQTPQFSIDIDTCPNCPPNPTNQTMTAASWARTAPATKSRPAGEKDCLPETGRPAITPKLALTPPVHHTTGQNERSHPHHGRGPAAHRQSSCGFPVARRGPQQCGSPAAPDSAVPLPSALGLRFSRFRNCRSPADLRGRWASASPAAV